jgi:hypothetical protein
LTTEYKSIEETDNHERPVPQDSKLDSLARMSDAKDRGNPRNRSRQLAQPMKEHKMIEATCIDRMLMPPDLIFLSRARMRNRRVSFFTFLLLKEGKMIEVNDSKKTPSPRTSKRGNQG